MLTAEGQTGRMGKGILSGGITSICLQEKHHNTVPCAQSGGDSVALIIWHSSLDIFRFSLQSVVLVLNNLNAHSCHL